jgi:branched-chain amino acid transport system ATP-binding protein
MSLLTLEGLHKSFGGNQAVRDVSFEVKPGELLALIGPNGAGKSTLFNLLNGQLKADAGRATFKGQSLNGLSPQAIWRLGVGRTFQIPETFASLTVLENVQMALLSHERRLFRFWQKVPGQAAGPALQLLEKVGMAEAAGQACGVLSYGDIKRVELAMALANRPQLLLMDEPTAGMAPKERHALMALVQDLADSTHMAVLFTEHSMDVVFGFADRIVVLARGKLIAEGSPEHIRQHPKVQEVYFGQPEATAP